MKAFVLGAGLGTRLMPLTATLPKPLVPVHGRPLITYAFDHLIAAGVDSFVVNTHHHAAAYEAALGAKDGLATYRDCPIAFRYEPILLDTGGGLANVRDLLGESEPFFVHNGDILADLDLEKLWQAHCASGAALTLALRSGVDQTNQQSQQLLPSARPLALRSDDQTKQQSQQLLPSARPLALRSNEGHKNITYRDSDSAVLDARGILGVTSADTRLCAFTGIYVASPIIFDYLDASRPNSVVMAWIEMIRQGLSIRGLCLDQGYWGDIGTLDAYHAIEQTLPEKVSITVLSRRSARA